MIKKSVQAKAPYNHDTFNINNNYLIGLSGMLGGGRVTTSGATVTVQPLTWVQNGLIVSSDSALSVSLPVNLTPPYFLAVTSSSPIENPLEVITPTFVKRPEDISAGTVLVAEWDGQEWRPLPPLSTAGINQAVKDANVREAMVGIASGFDVTKDSTNIYVFPGSAIAADGSPVTKNISTTLPKVAVDANGLDRIDEVVLRKPLDNPARIATLQYVVGPTFNAGGTVQLFAAQTINSLGPNAAKTINDPASDALYIVSAEGASPNITLKYLTAPNATTAPTPVSTIATGVDTYDSILNPDGSIDLVYVKALTLCYKRISATGTVLFAEQIIYTSPSTITNPKLVTVKAGSGYYIHVVFEKFISITHRQLGYVRLDGANNVQTTFQVLVDISANLKNPSLAKDDDDALFLLAFEDSGTGNAYLRTYDASTPTISSPPSQIGLPIILQDNTYNLSTAALLATTGATNPIVRRTANKETFVFWRHNKGSGVYGVAVYNANYVNAFGFKALVKDLYAIGENVDQFSVAIDGLNVAHFLLRETGVAGAANLRLTDFTVSEAQLVLASGCVDVAIRFTSRGALIHAYADTLPSSKMRKSTAGLITTLRDRFLPPTDVYMVHYRTGDGAISVAGTAIEEDPSIKRLYEFNNLFAATGTVTWGGSSTHLLTIQSPLLINGFNRSSTYTILANGPGGLVVPDGSVVFVNLPDADMPANLALNVVPFGKGMLDRYGRTALPMFWAVAGVLYTKFAPFRLEAGGETIIIGESLSDAERNWLGMPITPDPSNHAYTSTNYITQSSNYNAALAILDTAIYNLTNQFQFASNIETLSNGSTSKVVVFGTAQPNANYSLVPTMENLVDPNPQFQPMTLTAKSTAGFTVAWNTPLDGSNYQLDWIVSWQPPLTGVIALTAGTTSKVITFGSPRGSPSYRILLSLENETDALPQFQTFTITNKTVNGFTASWNYPLDSNNYSLGYVATN